uniref:Uncharacterized protein n=1 Tax=viral metagenome TaxID=1070528 RepID=A0A6C0EDM9_9ZZZZ
MELEDLEDLNDINYEFYLEKYNYFLMQKNNNKRMIHRYEIRSFFEILTYQQFVKDFKYEHANFFLKSFLSYFQKENFDSSTQKAYRVYMSLLDKIFIKGKQMTINNMYTNFLKANNFILSDYTLALYKPKIKTNTKIKLQKKLRNNILMTDVLNKTEVIVNKNTNVNLKQFNKMTIITDVLYAQSIIKTKKIDNGLLKSLFNKAIEKNCLNTLKAIIERSDFIIKKFDFGIFYKKARQRHAKYTKNFGKWKRRHSKMTTPKNESIICEVFDILKTKTNLVITNANSYFKYCTQRRLLNLAHRIIPYLDRTKIKNIDPIIFIIDQKNYIAKYNAIYNNKLTIGQLKKYVDSKLIKMSLFHKKEFRVYFGKFLTKIDDSSIDYLINVIKTKPLFTIRSRPKNIDLFMNICKKYNLQFPIQFYGHRKTNKDIIKYAKENNLNIKTLKPVYINSWYKYDADIMNVIKKTSDVNECVRLLDSVPNWRGLSCDVCEMLYKKYNNRIFSNVQIVNNIILNLRYSSRLPNKQVFFIKKFEEPEIIKQIANVVDIDMTPRIYLYFTIRCKDVNVFLKPFITRYSAMSAKKQGDILNQLEYELQAGYFLNYIEIFRKTKKNKENFKSIINILSKSLTPSAIDVLIKEKFLSEEDKITIVLQSCDTDNIIYSINKLNYEKYFDFNFLLHALIKTSEDYRMDHKQLLMFAILFKIADKCFKFLSNVEQINMVLCCSKIHNIIEIFDNTSLINLVFSKTKKIQKTLYDKHENKLKSHKLTPVNMEFDLSKIDEKYREYIEIPMERKKDVREINNVDNLVDKEYIKILDVKDLF